jgi:hypothetical protein
MSVERLRLDRLPSALLLLAAVYSIALVVGGFIAPVYSTSSSSSSGDDATGTDTLVGVNGRGVVFDLLIPLLVTVLVAVALLLRPRRRAMTVAWTLTGLLAAFNLLAMLSIGIFILPVTGALFVACRLCQSQPRDLPAPTAVA